MRKFADGLYQATLTLWVGGMWAIGYIVAPLLFSTLESRQLAGMVAGKLFAVMGWVGLGAAAYLLAYLLLRLGAQTLRRLVFWLILIMAFMSAASVFGIQPLMAQLKADALPREVMESVFRDRFSAWHGVSSILYLLQSMLGLWVVVLGARGVK